MKVQYRQRALADLEDIYQYLEQRSPAGARNVLAAIHDAIGLLTEYPDSAERTSDPDIRVKVLGRYRYKIFYRIADDAVDILHIRHAARRPW
jgi:plasmid stabilization system protein ParE